MSTAQKAKQDELAETIERERRLARRREKYHIDRERLNKKRREEREKQKGKDVVIKNRKNDPRGPVVHATKCRCGAKVYVWVDGVCLACSLKRNNNTTRRVSEG